MFLKSGRFAGHFRLAREGVRSGQKAGFFRKGCESLLIVSAEVNGFGAQNQGESGRELPKNSERLESTAQERIAELLHVKAH